MPDCPYQHPALDHDQAPGERGAPLLCAQIYSRPLWHAPDAYQCGKVGAKFQQGYVHGCVFVYACVYKNVLSEIINYNPACPSIGASQPLLIKTINKCREVVRR